MKARWLAGAVLVGMALSVAVAVSQPPAEGRRGPPPRFELGKVLPPFVEEELDLSKDQKEQLARLEKDVKERLEKILTDKQKEKIKTLRPLGPGGPPPGGPGRPGREQGERSPPLSPDAVKTFVKNAHFTEAGADARAPAGYILKGDVQWAVAGTKDEFAPRGVALLSGKDLDGDGTRSGSVAQDVTGFEGGVNKWFRFSVRGLAESNFAVKNDDLFLRVDFLAAKGANSLDGVSRKIYPLVERDRAELLANGNFRKNGGAVWKTYALEFRLPFAEIDQLRLVVGFKGGCAPTEKDAAFYVTDWALVPVAQPASAPQVVKAATGYEPSLKSLIPLGGRWYYDPEPGTKARPARLTVSHANAARLFYRDGRLTNPFAENMTAWLRKGYLDIDGKVVEQDRLIADNVVVRFEDDKTLIVRARNIPNHPTAQFPERFGNPSYIQEHDTTYYLALDPVRNPRAVAMDRTNSNRALPMGPIGIAINGVVFFNPFDAGMRDATDMMDRCCGHPSPDNRYHYHKYPVCVKSPFVDEGEAHSPLIGWAFDGFPIYGPYEGKGVMARDSKENPLNEFNVHYDEVRGWHYHVTPGRFPYVIGGYWGEVDARNFPRRRGPDKPGRPPEE
jgi:hypothetical protein